jgi:hypothetical protein
MGQENIYGDPFAWFYISLQMLLCLLVDNVVIFHKKRSSYFICFTMPADF